MVLIAQIQISITFKGDAVCVFLPSDDHRGTAHTVPCRIDSFGGHEHKCHGAVNQLLSITDTVDEIFFLIDDGSDQLCGIDVSPAHFQKMSIAVLIDKIRDLLCVVDFAHGGDGVGSVVRADDQGLGFIIGDTSDAQIALHLPHVLVKLGPERCIFYIVNGTVKTILTIYSHAAPPCTKMRMVVCSKKQVKDAVVL